jgi:periplasmic protein TonB
MFEALEGNNRFDAAKRFLALSLSIALHGLAIIMIIVLPLVFLQLVPGSDLLAFLIAAPGPPLSPPPPIPHPTRPAQVRPEHGRMHLGSADMPPQSMPRGIAEFPEDPPAGPIPSGFEGLASGLPGGLGLVPAGLIGSVIEAMPPMLMPPPTPPKRKPLPIGGKVQEAKLIRKVTPDYPELPRRAHISGAVIMEVVVDEEGNVSEVKVRQGHPLLVEAAVQAVKQWRYSPTLLNGEPVPVVSTVTIIFSLN